MHKDSLRENMKRSPFVVFSLLALTSMMLSACANTPIATKQPIVNESRATEMSTINPSVKETPASCTPAGTEPIAFPEGGRSVAGALDQEPDFIVPYFSHMPVAKWITQLTLVGLGEWDGEGILIPELAAEIPTIENGGLSEDGLTITWRLKDCLFWSDGIPLTSEDIKFTWEVIMDSSNVPVSRNGYDKIVNIDTSDPLTAVITFSERYTPWQILFTQGANNQGAILPKHMFNEQTSLEGNDFIHQPTIGSGPFVITEWVPGDSITLLPNSNFYEGQAKLDRIQLRFVANSAAALASLRKRDVDWYSNFSETDISAINALEPDIHLLVVPGSNIEHYFFNLGRTEGVDGRGKSDNDGFCPFKDVRVRKAVTLGINRQTIVDTLLEGRATIPISLWPNKDWTNTSIHIKFYDPEAAAALLDEAGYTVGPDGIRVGDCNGEQTRLAFNFKTTADPISLASATSVRKDLTKIGVDFMPLQIPTNTFFGRYIDGGTLAVGDYDMGGYTTSFYPDPYTDNFQCEAIPTVEKPYGLNWYHLCDPFLSDLMDSLLATADAVERKAILDEAQIYIAENYYVIPMYARAEVYGYTDRFIIGPTGPQSGLNWNAEIWDVKE